MFDKTVKIQPHILYKILVRQDYFYVIVGFLQTFNHENHSRLERLCNFSLMEISDSTEVIIYDRILSAVLLKFLRGGS